MSNVVSDDCRAWPSFKLFGPESPGKIGLPAANHQLQHYDGGVGSAYYPSQDEPMFELIDKVLAIPVPFNMIIMMMAIIFGAGIVTSFAKQIRKYFCLRQELEFKREMIDRGMTPDEIERLVKCKTPTQMSDV